MNDFAGLFATWVVHNVIERRGQYRWFYANDEVWFTWQVAASEWLDERRRTGLPFPTGAELKAELLPKPYCLGQEARRVGGMVYRAYGLSIPECHKAGLDVPASLRGVVETGFVHEKGD